MPTTPKRPDPYAATAVADPYAATATQDAPPAPPQQSSIMGTVGDLGKGLLQGGLSTYANLGGLVAKIPGIGTAHPFGQPSLQEQVQAMQPKIAPQNTAQKVGKGIEQAGEFLLPGLGEEAAATKAASLLPALGKAALPVAKIGAAATGAALVNKAQGGTLLGGAVAGGLGSGVGQAIKAVAPVLAESALKVGKTDRFYEANPGRAILDDTTGLTPKATLTSGQQTMDALTADRNAIALNAPDLSLAAPRQVARDAAATASNMNEKLGITRTGELNDLLTFEGNTPARIPDQVPMPRALALRAGTGALKNSWNPNTPNTFADGAVGQAYHALTDAIHTTAPEIGPIDSRMQSLIPVLNRAGAADLNAGWIQRGIARLGAHTGALAAPIGAAVYGGASHGLPGAVAGGLGTLAGTELLTSPTTWLTAARMANAPSLTKYGVPILTGAALQATRKTE